MAFLRLGSQYRDIFAPTRCLQRSLPLLPFFVRLFAAVFHFVSLSFPFPSSLFTSPLDTELTYDRYSMPSIGNIRAVYYTGRLVQHLYYNVRDKDRHAEVNSLGRTHGESVILTTI